MPTAATATDPSERRSADARRRDDRRRAAPLAARTTAPDGGSPSAAARARPGGRPRHVVRTRLLDELRALAPGTTVLLHGPAGYGKSSLIDEWSRADPRRFAWVDAAACRDDAAHLAAALIEAFVGRAGGRRRHRCTRAADDELARAVAAGTRGNGAVLVLDDVDVLAGDSLALVGAVARRLPDGVVLVLAGRAAPSVGLARLRAAGRLMELGPGELALTAREARELLAAAAIEVSPAALSRLLERTQGWPAALALAAASWPHDRVGAPEAVTRACAAGGTEYVREEVLAPLPPAERELLLSATVADVLCPELCDELRGRRGSGRLLRRLHERGLLTPAGPDGGSYRCHALVRTTMHAELAACEPERLRELDRRAGVWLAEQGEVERALDHLVRARDSERAAELLWQDPERWMRPDGAARTWLATLGRDQVAARPRLSTIAAHAMLAAGELAAACEWARTAGAALARGGEEPDRSALRGALALVNASAGAGGPDQMERDAAAAYAAAAEDSPLRALACLLRGVAAQLQGDTTAAAALLRESERRTSRALPHARAHTLAQLALLHAEEQSWDLAEDACERALRVVAEAGLGTGPAAALPLASAGLAKSRRGACEEAKAHLLAASELLDGRSQLPPWQEVQARIALARTAAALGDVRDARSRLAEASRLARRTPAGGPFEAMLDAAWGELDAISAAALIGQGALTMAELRILRFLPSHLSFREIGERLHVSTNTVKSQAHSVYAKLGAISRTEAVARAARLGLVDAAIV
jgi:LuxR family maltose regulon positive regulatory protein